MQRYLPLLFALALAACTTDAARIDRLAAAGGLVREIYQAGPHTTLIYMRRPDAADTRPLVVFFEGDGRPRKIALEPYIDPTTAHPIALELALRTPARVAYITRPCYQELKDASCNLDTWVVGRYSDDIVESLANSVREAARKTNASEVELVGYSGGGTLAVLIAERLDNVARVVTIGANLDTDAWTSQHGYPALARSLNPALSEHEHDWPELHLLGTRDDVVPSRTVGRYFERYPNARQWIIDGVDHTCCWVDRWPELWAQMDAKLQ